MGTEKMATEERAGGPVCDRHSNQTVTRFDVVRGTFVTEMFQFAVCPVYLFALLKHYQGALASQLNTIQFTSHHQSVLLRAPNWGGVEFTQLGWGGISHCQRISKINQAATTFAKPSRLDSKSKGISV